MRELADERELGPAHGLEGARDTAGLVADKRGMWIVRAPEEQNKRGVLRTGCYSRLTGNADTPLTVSVGWVVIEDAASGPIVAAQHDEVALVIRGTTEAVVATGGEAAVLDRA